MGLYTKSAQFAATVDDGIRICIMRRPDSALDWDIWMPHLAPSDELLTAYHQQKISWDEFCVQFKINVLEGKSEYLDILIDMAKKRKITLLCWEETPDKCHRRLIAQACAQRSPSLNVSIK